LSPKVKTPEEGRQLCPVHRGQILWDFLVSSDLQ
jgi:hypothetical protein